ncbi:hypothetical protein [Ancylobacter sp.]|uniref:hypothetical protein n=1 Tax=Ancylobacter sp. TaxID=1872567 RepID=UPI003D13D8C2
MSFYLKDGPPFIEDEAMAFFASSGVSVVPFDIANRLAPVELFESIEGESGYLALPRKERFNTPIPYNPAFHHKYSVQDKAISSLVLEYIESNLSSRKYLFSARPDICLAIYFQEFTYEIIREISPGHLTTPLILFDDRRADCILFECDLEINTVSRSSAPADAKFAGRSGGFWIHYFNDNFLKSIAYNEHHIGLINEFYGPLFPGLHIPLRSETK